VDSSDDRSYALLIVTSKISFYVIFVPLDEVN
jgi:hypothetical protein